MAGVVLDAQTRMPAHDHGARPERVPVRAALRVGLDDAGHAATVSPGADTTRHHPHVGGRSVVVTRRGELSPTRQADPRAV